MAWIIGVRSGRGVGAAVSLLLWAVLLAPTMANATPLNAEQADRLRIRRHLAQVEASLREASTVDLDASARENRQRMLDVLHEYWQAGIFPRNTGHPGERRPYFIDDEGRACAVGVLIIASDHAALATRIDREFHTEYVPDMNDGELLAWAGTYGFSVSELAQIQPSYCSCGTSFDSVYGDAAAGWDGGDPFQPVCGTDGLSYWNACIAESCGGVTIAASGLCDRDEPPCELCGTGTREAIVSECGAGNPTGICSGLESQPDLAPVNEDVAARWLELQQAGCQDPDYAAPFGRWDESTWQPSFWAREELRETWECSANGGGSGGAGTGAGNGEAPDASINPDDVSATPADNSSDSGGCATVHAGRPSRSTALYLLVIAFLVHWRRRSTAAPALDHR